MTKSLTIEKGVPLPADSRGRNNSYVKETVAKCKAGDSFVMNKSSRWSLHMAAKELGLQFTTRSVDKQSMRVWILGREKKR